MERPPGRACHCDLAVGRGQAAPLGEIGSSYRMVFAGNVTSSVTSRGLHGYGSRRAVITEPKLVR